jgi:protein-L-isoaspartate(D-aspartate) O-methyltransferase
MEFETDDIFMKKEDLMKRLGEDTKVFENKAIQKAFEAIDRKDFVEDDYKVEAYEDYPLPTLEGQTISQPTTVAFMLELLDPQEGDTVLDIGSGSGWTTALAWAYCRAGRQGYWP